MRVRIGSNVNYTPIWRSVDLPAPTITTSDQKTGASGWLEIEDDGKPVMKRKPTNKPPYKVPSMDEIRAIPWNGYKVASTFSGAGGSCLGYRMAGFKVVWANEFVPAAQDSYRANMEPDCILDRRDIKNVTALDILQATGLSVGELDLFDGSPPCQAFSTAGKRSKGWGKLKAYAHGAQQKNEELFFDYIRLLDGLQPKVFVAENVSGLVKGVAKGFFLEILAGLKACGYRVKAKLLDAQWLGVPQTRKRVIFVGVRNDLGLEPVHPKPLKYRYSVRDALPWIVKVAVNRLDYVQASTVQASTGKRTSSTFAGEPLGMVEAETDISRYAIGAEWDKMGKPGTQSEKYFQLTRPHLDEPSGTITQRGGDNTVASVVHPTEKRKFSIAELKRICAFPDDFILTGSYAQQWARLGNSVPPVMMWHIASAIRDEILCNDSN